MSSRRSLTWLPSVISRRGRGRAQWIDSKGANGAISCYVTILTSCASRCCLVHILEVGIWTSKKAARAAVPRLAKQLLEGERVWALLRAAYLAGADYGANCRGPFAAAAETRGNGQDSKEGSKEGAMMPQLLIFQMFFTDVTHCDPI